MRVRMLEQISGRRNGERWPAPGDTIDLGDNEGADLCAQGVAEPVEDKAEKATAPAAKKAAPPKPRKKA